MLALTPHPACQQQKALTDLHSVRAFCLALLLAVKAFSQATILSANPTVIRVNFSVVIGYSGPTRAASVQFTATAPSTNFLIPSLGSAAVAAEKTLQCNPLAATPPPQSMTCLVFSMNQTEIAPGTIVNFYAVAVPDSKPGDMKLVLSNIAALDGAGNVVPITIIFPTPPPIAAGRQEVQVEDAGLSLVVKDEWGRHVWFRAVGDRENIQLWPHVNFTAAEPYPMTEEVPHNDTGFYGNWQTYAGGWSMGATIGCHDTPTTPPDAVFSIRSGRFVVTAADQGHTKKCCSNTGTEWEQCNQ